jgi:hypothetical protein
MTKAAMDACLYPEKTRAMIKRDLIIEVGDVSAEQKRKAYERLETLKRELGFKMKTSATFFRAISQI